MTKDILLPGWFCVNTLMQKIVPINNFGLGDWEICGKLSQMAAKKHSPRQGKSPKVTSDDLRTWAKRIHDIARHIENWADDMDDVGIEHIRPIVQKLNTMVKDLEIKTRKEFRKRIEQEIEELAIKDVMELEHQN